MSWKRITELSGYSRASFYQYFSDVEEAILVLADEATDEIVTVEPLLERSWTDTDGLANVDAFVEALMEYWEAHSVILRVRDLRAEEGDKRFWAVRTRGYAAIVPALTTKIEEAQAAGRLTQEINPYAAASAAMAMLERLFTYQSVFRRRGVTKEAMTTTLGAMLHSTVTGLSNQ